MAKHKIDERKAQECWDILLSEHAPERRKARARKDLESIYVPLVQVVARRVHQKLPSSVEYGDLLSDGYFGLIDAINKFDPERGFKFETYASSRIKGEITDKLRDYDWVSRYFRLKFKEVSQTRDLLLQELQREPTEEEVAERLGWPVDQVNRMQAGFNNSFHINIDERMRDSTHEYFKLSELIADQTSGDITYGVEREELIDRIVAALDGLKKNETTVLYLYLYRGENYSTIASELGMTPGRVSQIYDSALKNLRRKLTLE